MNNVEKEYLNKILDRYMVLVCNLDSLKRELNLMDKFEPYSFFCCLIDKFYNSKTKNNVFNSCEGTDYEIIKTNDTKLLFKYNNIGLSSNFFYNVVKHLDIKLNFIKIEEVYNILPLLINCFFNVYDSDDDGLIHYKE